VAKKYPVLYTILVWIGIAAFGFTTFYGMPKNDGGAGDSCYSIDGIHQEPPR
jgi:hypothetical protein